MPDLITPASKVGFFPRKQDVMMWEERREIRGDAFRESMRMYRSVYGPSYQGLYCANCAALRDHFSRLREPEESPILSRNLIAPTR